ncbi:hypothetical protein Patl1_07339 [Pistacia atlantica]|uniref:Uncharacterized protein n=1 Tax=Pistacia atlantica TaxID=434234 RepID=A0ACC1AJ18_9ROSI|nr:hypothetical protein Patl1_07339 [Pistacia atlantica]
MLNYLTVSTDLVEVFTDDSNQNIFGHTISCVCKRYRKGFVVFCGNSIFPTICLSLSYVPIGAILDLNPISDQSILIDCLHYVVASKYHYFWFWIFQIIPAGDPDPFFSDPSIKRFILFIKNRR